MGNVTFLYPPGVKFFPRSYVVGFNLPLTIVNTVISGGYLSFDTNTLQHHWDLKIRPTFLPANSNHYSIDYVFDEADSWHYFLGVPGASLLNIQLARLPDEFEWRIFVASEFARDVNQSPDLPALSGYWRPESFHF